MKTNIHGWICIDVDEIGRAVQRFVFFTHKPDGESYVPVFEHTIEADVPDDFDPRPMAVAAIDVQITKARAEFTDRLTELQQQKQRLLAIENTVDA